MKIILEGEMWLEAIGPDEVNPTLIKAVAGDVIRIKKGTVVRFSSPNHSKGSSLPFSFYFYIAVAEADYWTGLDSLLSILCGPERTSSVVVLVLLMSSIESLVKWDRTRVSFLSSPFLSISPVHRAVFVPVSVFFAIAFMNK